MAAINEVLPAHTGKDLTGLTQLPWSLCDDKESVNEALRKIQEEAELLATDASMRVGDARHELPSLQKLTEQLQFEHPLALQVFCSVWKKPIGTATRSIEEMITIAGAALEILNPGSTESENSRAYVNSIKYGRHIFSYQIARILRDTLNIEPTLTRDDPDIITGERKGAAYARVLREALWLAGIEPANDLLELMRHGLRLLNCDPRGDRYEPEQTGGITP